ncbi:hypothetical protein D3C72_907230 [compost metagenome]
MFIRGLFISIVLLASGLILYSSIGLVTNYSGVGLSMALALGAFALMHPFYPKCVSNWIDRVVTQLTPKSDKVRIWLALALMSWAFAWSMFTSISTHAPTGKGRYLFGPIYNLAGNDGIGVVFVILGVFLLGLAIRSNARKP